jgi:hypothetical protein
LAGDAENGNAMLAHTYATTSKHRLDHPADGLLSGLEEEMEVVREERPGIAGRLRRPERAPEALQEVPPIRVIRKNPPLLDSSNDNVVKGAGSVNPSEAGHGGKCIPCVAS